MMKIQAPKHMKKPAAIVYRWAAKHLHDAGIYHDFDRPMIEGYANLVIRLQSLEAEDPLPEERLTHARTIATLMAKLEATSKALGLTLIERKKREPKKIGRPRKNTGAVAKPDDSTEWGKLGIITGGKQ